MNICESCKEQIHLKPTSGAIEVLVGGGAPPVDPDVVTKLPRASPPGMSVDEEGQVETPKVGNLRYRLVALQRHEDFDREEVFHHCIISER